MGLEGQHDALPAVGPSLGHKAINERTVPQVYAVIRSDCCDRMYKLWKCFETVEYPHLEPFQAFMPLFSSLSLTK